MTQPPPYGSPPYTPYPTSGAPQQPDPWGAQQPAAWGQQPPPGQWGPPQQDQWGQPQDQWGQQPPGQWGQQPQGQWGQQPPPPYPPQPQGTNGFAVASLIFGILGGVLFSVIFGFVALSQIRRRGQGGKGLAIAGLSLSGVWVLGIAAIVVIGAIASGTGDNDPTSSTLADSGDVRVEQLRPGQCLNGLEERSAIRNLPVVPCAEPHEGEVYAVFELPGGTYPGDDKVVKAAEDGCFDRLETQAPKAADDPDTEVYFLHPTSSSWRLGDQGVTCVAMSGKGKVTGSIQD